MKDVEGNPEREKLCAFCGLAGLCCWEYRYEEDRLLWSGETDRAPEGVERLGDTFGDFLEAVYPDDRQRVEQLWRTAGQSDAVAAGEFRVFAGDGLRWVWARCRTQFDNGRPVRLLGVLQDITARKETEEGWQALAEDQETLLGNIPAMVFWMDREGRFVQVSSAFAQTQSRTPQEMRGCSLYQLFPREMAERFDRENRSIVETGAPMLGLEEAIPTPDGLGGRAPTRSPCGTTEDALSVSLGPQRTSPPARRPKRRPGSRASVWTSPSGGPTWGPGS
ncbi:MAG: PAS domain-containing protein [Synergistales bacterium]|nr:PAS domain-containing protein [Synergistales bacterium]